MKKIYVKPTVTFHKVKQTKILCASGDGERRRAKECDDELGYIPGVTCDLNTMA
ncbi:MAG: hypothetical protein J5658_02365 [Prevotella sp.]|nr:hypothetical protein [Prevotella sp.]